MVLAHPEGGLVADSAPFCPYVGLRPFREEDRPYFFGRENEIRTIADNLYGARLTILYGASGVGKSSVLMAGLVPQLRKEPRTAVVMFRRWQVPQAAALLKRQVIESASAVGGKSLAIDENLPLDELLKQAADTVDGTILLLLDQFEEYFLYFPDPGPEGGFDAELARAINRRGTSTPAFSFRCARTRFPSSTGSASGSRHSSATRSSCLTCGWALPNSRSLNRSRSTTRSTRMRSANRSRSSRHSSRPCSSR